MDLINTLHQGDCLELLAKLENNSIDLCVTDPPYLMSYKTNYRKNKEHRFCKVIQNDDNAEVIKKVIPEIHRVLKDNTALYMFCSQDHVDFFLDEVKKYFKVKNLIVWVKNNWTAGDLKAQFGKQYEFIIYANKGRRPINGKRLTDVWMFDRVAGVKQLHQNQKPVELLKQCIEKSSNPNDLVLDPFAGVSSTAVACIESSRNFICMEKDPYYFDIGATRLEELKENTNVIR